MGRSGTTDPGGSSSSGGGFSSGAGLLCRLAALAGSDVEAGADLQLPVAVRRLQAAVRDWATDTVVAVGGERGGGQGQGQGAGRGRIGGAEQLGVRAGGGEEEEGRGAAGAVAGGGRRVGAVVAGAAAGAAAAAAAAESVSHLALGLLRRLEWPLDVDVNPDELQVGWRVGEAPASGDPFEGVSRSLGGLERLT